MSKRNKIILLVVGIVLLISLIYVATHQKEEISEYDFQELYLEKADMVNFKEASELFHNDVIMDYEDYVQFCIEWNLQQNYTDSGKYAIHAKMYDGVRSSEIDEIIRTGSHIDAIGICYGAVNTEYITVDFLVIPVKNKVKTITYMERIDGTYVNK